MRKTKVVEGQIYHVCNKSIANFNIFKSPRNARRFLQTVTYYNKIEHPKRLSKNIETKTRSFRNILLPKTDSLVKFIGYCIMPDHYHFIVKFTSSAATKRFSKYISDIQNSFTRYFNIKTGRKGPLWQSRFRIVHIKTSEQLLHTTRYVHLNPTTSNLVEKPEDWEFSSYKKFVQDEKFLKIMTELTISNPEQYKKFVEDRIDYQRKLKKIKNLLLE